MAASVYARHVWRRGAPSSCISSPRFRAAVTIRSVGGGHSAMGLLPGRIAAYRSAPASAAVRRTRTYLAGNRLAPYDTLNGLAGIFFSRVRPVRVAPFRRSTGCSCSPTCGCLSSGVFRSRPLLCRCFPASSGWRVFTRAWPPRACVTFATLYTLCLPSSRTFIRSLMG
jgi:hypothetical protein